MGGKSGGGAPPIPLSPEGMAYLQRYADVAQNWAGTPEQHYQMYGKNEGRTWGLPPAGPGIDYAAMLAGFTEQSAGYAEELAKQQAEAERLAGEQQRDQLYSDYMTAAETATDYINQMITGQQANADLLGIEYSITNEDKSTMISDYFASIWGAGEQTQLEQLMKQWGNPAGFTDFLVKRGDASKFQTGEEGSETSKAVSKPALAVESAENTDEASLSKKSLLGG